MDLWHPPTDQPHLLEWWRPLLLASRAARLARCPWPIHPDELTLRGRVDRGARPSIWIYKHAESRGELYLDSTGQTYKFTKTPNGPSLGRFTPCDVRAAVWGAGLPSFVEPVWYDAPRLGRGWGSEDDPEDDPDDDIAQDDTSADDARAVDRLPTSSERPLGCRRHGHLTVIDGGRPLAG